MDQVQKITVNLNIFDKDGDIVDGTTSELTLSQICDIIDLASQIILLRRNGGDFESILDELDESLSVADVIENLDGPGAAP